MVLMLLALHAAIHSTAPGLGCRRSSITRLSAILSSPFSNATRFFKLVEKSISPRMALSVIAETCGFRFIMSAISSMHSILISVESISITASPNWLRRCASGTNAQSICCDAQNVCTSATSLKLLGK